MVHRISQLFCLVCLIDAVASLFIPYRISIQVVGLLMAIGCTFFLVAGFMSFRKGYRPARFFIIAWFTFLTGNILFSMSSFGIIPSIFITEKGMYIGSLIEVVLLSFALGDRINMMKREKEEAQRLAIENLHKADRLKDEFLANTSHELRTPLNGIIGLAESLMDGVAGTLPDKARGNLSMIAASGRRLSSLVNDILDYAKLRNRDIALSIRPVDVRTIAGIVMEMSLSLVGNKKLELVNSISRDFPPVDADENRLEQILINLVGNAIKFTRGGTVEISAVVRGGFAEISVRDTGIGIPAGSFERIFESFEQVDGSVAREFGGTGLGLSITRKLVELHGSAITVESEVGRGSVFRFNLPLSKKPEAVIPGMASDDANETHTPAMVRLSDAGNDVGPAGSAALMPFREDAGTGNARILIVDDDPVNLQVLENQLTMHNYDVIKSMDGYDALEKISSGNLPDLILLDIMMPRISGFDVSRALREKYSLFDLPIMMLTAKNHVEDMITGFNSGANDYLSKPFDKNELMARVKTLVALKLAVGENRRLFSIYKEFEVARRILEAVIPADIPARQGVDIAVKYMPMESVGGDYYDFNMIENDEIGVFISDVSGHGVTAALIASMVKIVFNNLKSLGTEPEKMLNRMNEMLVGNIDRYFLTASYARINVGKKRMSFARAGHEPLIIHRRSTGEFMKHLPHGHAMGWNTSGNSELVEIALETGDRIILYTDGIIEAFNSSGSMYGSRRLMDAVLGGKDLPARELADSIILQLHEWCPGSSQMKDDITLIVIDI